MNKFVPTISCVIPLACSFLGTVHADSDKIAQWNRWEHSLSSVKNYPNPYHDVTLSVTYTGPQNQVLKTYGFWDGGTTFKIRCAFPTAGQWTWRTSSSDSTDSGLDQQSGNVTVLPYTGTNVLYQHGFLKVDSGKRHLDFADDIPFLWTGDTAWIAPLNASEADWKTYVDNRVENKFSVIQLSPASAWSLTHVDTEGNAPFTGEGLAQWNPKYWQGYEEKVAYANSRGICVLVVGLMEPAKRYPTPEEASLFARNLVARLYGNFVIFSASFDSSEKMAGLGNTVGQAIRDATSVHLVTQHGGTGLSIAQIYHDQPYADFASYQSGHNGGDRTKCANQAVKWGLDLYNRVPTKPVLNVEAFYDANQFQKDNPKPDLRYAGTARDARSLGYLSRLSGSFGYTYGAYGIWNWISDPASPVAWSKAIQYPSAEQMKWQTEFFAGIDWWRLVPAPDCIVNQSKDMLKYVAFAKAADGDLAVAYLPDNSSVQIAKQDTANILAPSWFDPTTGKFVRNKIPPSLSESGSIIYTPPTPGEWVLLFKK